MVRQWVVGASRVGMFVKQLLFKNYELAIWGMKTEKSAKFSQLIEEPNMKNTLVEWG